MCVVVTAQLIWAKSARTAARLANRKLSSRGSSIGSRPFTAPSEPSSSRPATSESKLSQGMSTFASELRRELNPEPEVEPEPQPQPQPQHELPPDQHPEFIRLHRRPRNGRSHTVKIMANGNRVEMRREDDDRREALRPETPPPVEGEPMPTEMHKRYRCVAQPGAIARSGIELKTEQTDVVYNGEVVVALAQGVSSTGVARVRCDRGWLSLTASNGQPILAPADPPSGTDPVESVVPSPRWSGARRSYRGHPPSGGSEARLRLRKSQQPVVVGAGNAGAYPSIPSSTLGTSAGEMQRQKQLEDMRRASPPSGRQSVSSVARNGGALPGEWTGPVIKGAQWQRTIRKLKHSDPTTGRPTAVRPAVGVGSDEVKDEERRLRGSIAFFDASIQGSEHSQAGGLKLWARKGHVSSKPVDSSGAAPVGGRVSMQHRQSAWQSPALFFQKIEDVVEEAEEASRKRAIKKARKIMQAQREREAARKIWVRGEQVELPPTPPPRQAPPRGCDSVE